MEGFQRKEGGCPQLLDLIPKGGEWNVKIEEKIRALHSEDKKLELRLGPPDGDWDKTSSRGDGSLVSFCSFSNTISGTKRGFTGEGDHVFAAPWFSSSQQETKSSSSSFLQLQAVKMSKESSHHCCSNKGAAVVDLQQTAEMKAFSQSSAATNTAVPTNSNIAQKRSAPAPVVGWPPVRSFRKNLASNSNSKPNGISSQNEISKKVCEEKPNEKNQKCMFVKINMDGVPIGRKVDLQAYDSYEKLSSSVDELFRGLLAAQGDSSAGIKKNGEGEKVISGLLDGSGEYTLVYEDNEGDRMLVGDVPWHMFVSTVKRLRVLKTSEISSLCRGGIKHGKLLSIEVSPLK